jgi:hypothetical protein
MEIAKHHKTGKVYIVIDRHVIDTTNSQDDRPMVLYSNLQGKLFVRDKGEFFYKFSMVDWSDVHHVDRRTEKIVNS